jgi:hypothetical protein
VSACKADYKTLEVAVEAYFAQTGAYPTAIADLTSGTYQLLRDDPEYWGLAGTTGELASVKTIPAGCPA